MCDTETGERSILVLRGPNAGQDDVLGALGLQGDVQVVDTLDAALQALRARRFDLVVSETADFLPLERAAVTQQANVILSNLGEGVCVADLNGRLLWANPKMMSLPAELLERICQGCRELHGPAERVDPRSRRFSITAEGDRYYEITATPVLDDTGRMTQVATVVRDATSSVRLQRKLDAIDRAGSELVRLDADEIAGMDACQRLDLLERKVISYTRELLHFDNFSIRLLDKKTNRLELVLSAGLPKSVGELDIFASSEDNGICGYVAATGRSYICTDVRSDPRYLPGIENACSSLTVPLRLHDHVIGVFNVESSTPAAFDEEDRQFAEIFARHVAIALHILDLLVVERFTTTGRLADDVTAEIAGPLNDILTDAVTLMEDYIGHDDLRNRLGAISDNVAKIKEVLKGVAAAPAGLIDSRNGTTPVKDPLLAGKTVLVADDEEIIRQTIRDVLTAQGCEVETARDGSEAIAMIARRRYDLVLSDIKMPFKNGYEIFGAAKDAAPDCAVILITAFGYDPNHSIVRARREGLSAVLFKPFKVADLLHEIHKDLTTR